MQNRSFVVPGALAIVGALVLAGALGAAPRYLEELALGGGYGSPGDGGADFMRNGDIRTNGDIRLDGTLRTAPPTTETARLVAPPGVAPAAAEDGALWTTPGGLYYQVGGATVGPLLDSARIPWDAPGAIGTTTPAALNATTGTFTGDVTLAPAGMSVINATGPQQFHINHTRAAGASHIRLSPVPSDGVSGATVDVFRHTSTQGAVLLSVKRGDGSNTGVLDVTAGAEPITQFRSGAGAAKLTVTHASGNVLSSGTGTFLGGEVTVGQPGTVTGVVGAECGPGAAAAGCLRLKSASGRICYLFVGQDGKLRISDSLPVGEDQGTVVGSQY